MKVKLVSRPLPFNRVCQSEERVKILNVRCHQSQKITFLALMAPNHGHSAPNKTANQQETSAISGNGLNPRSISHSPPSSQPFLLDPKQANQRNNSPIITQLALCCWAQKLKESQFIFRIESGPFIISKRG